MISVVVVNWNGKPLLADCLSSLRSQTFSDFEVVVVDNGSMDGSGEWIRENFPDFKLVQLDENRGDSVVGLRHGFRDARAQRVAINARGFLYVGRCDGYVIEPADH